LFLEGFDRLGRPRITDDVSAALKRLATRPPVHRYRQAYALRLGLGRAARRAAAALVHLGAPNATPLARGGALRVVTCHDLIPLRFPERYASVGEGFAWGRKRLDRRRYHGADHVIAISDATAQDLVAFLDLAEARMSVVPSGIDVDVWSAPPTDAAKRELSELGLERRNFLVYVGDGDWRKNATGMFAALAEARSRAPELGLELVWAAKLAPRRLALLRREAAAHGVLEAVRWVGFVSDDVLRGLYRAAVATLFVSRWEGFGFPVLEAMAAECPVITSDRSSLRELAEGAAVLVDPEDHGATARAVLELAVGAEERDRLRALGRERARRYTLERQAEGTLAVYRRLLGGG
jgi:glycosyltransferase involved in cell wall biosynthesis